MVDCGYEWDQISEAFKIKEPGCKHHYCNATRGPHYRPSTQWREAEDEFLDDQRAKGVAFDAIAVGMGWHTPLQCVSRY